MRAWDERERLLRVVQPALIGLIDGTVSTLAPMFAAAYVARLALGAARRHRRRARRGDQHGPLGGAVGRRRADRPRPRRRARARSPASATFVGGSLHALPFLIGDVHTALKVAYAVVAVELVVIALVRKRYLQVSLHRSLIQVTLGGAVVAFVGFAIGHA